MLRCLVVHCGEVAKMLPNNFRNNILCLKRLNFIIYKLIQEAWVIIWLESFNCQENENYSFAFLPHASINLGVNGNLCLPIQTLSLTSFFKNRIVRRNLDLLWAFKARYNVMYATRVLWDGAEHPRAAWTRVKREFRRQKEGKS